jgi:transcriptional regulator with XRE-family HTH domain
MKVTGQSIGAALKAKRLDRGLSLRRLAKASGVSHSMIDRVERQQCDPRVGDCEKLCRAMKIQITITP